MEAVSHEMQRPKKIRTLRDELCQGRERRQMTKKEVFRPRQQRILECKIRYLRPDHWDFILRGYMSGGYAPQVLEQRISVFCAERYLRDILDSALLQDNACTSCRVSI